MQDTITVLKSSFLISPDNVLPALEAIKAQYPEVKTYLKQPTVQLKFQYALYLLGWHTRIHNNGMIFGLSKTAPSNPLIQSPKYDEFLGILSRFAQPGSYVTLIVNGIEKTIDIKEDPSTLKPKELIDYLQEQQVEAEKHKVKKIITEAVAQEIAAEIVPDTLKTPNKTMADLVSAAIEKADEALNTELPAATEPVKKNVRKPKARKPTSKK